MSVPGAAIRWTPAAAGAAATALIAASLAMPATAQTTPPPPPTTTQTSPPPPPRDLAAVCDARVENHHLDFWLGKWDVYDRDERIAESTIEKLPGSCAILESYAQVDGYSGKSVNFYDAVLKKWRQTWVDKVGTVGEFTGELVDGAMKLEGETHFREGKSVLRRMTLSRVDDAKVRQFSERSSDGGKTWTIAYDFIYKRRQP